MAPLDPTGTDTLSADAPAAAPPRRGVLRGAPSQRAGEHTFAVVGDLPTFTPTRPMPTGDRTVDAVRSAAWDEGVALGMAEGRDRGHAEGVVIGREAGYAAGHAEGVAAGRAAVADEIAARLGPALAALDAAANDLTAREATSLADIESSVVDLAVSLAEAILDREVSVAANPGLDAIRRSLSLAPERGDLIVRLHPEELAELGSIDGLAPGRSLELVADPSVARGGCIAESGATRIDARLETALARARAALAISADAAIPGAL